MNELKERLSNGIFVAIALMVILCIIALGISFIVFIFKQTGLV